MIKPSTLQPLRCGIIGYGYMGEIRRKAIEQNPRCVLVGIVTTKEMIRSAVQEYKTFSSIDALLENDVDAIFVCTPNRDAPELCIKSMQRGKHVFCEKPPGRTVVDVRSIMKAEKENPGIKLMFGFNHRYHPAIIRANEIIGSGRLGSIINLRGVYGKSGGIHFRESWRNNKEISGGGILLDQGVHMLDLFRYFCGDFETVKSFLGNSFWNFDVEDNAFVILQSKKKQQAFLHSSSTMWKHTFELHITCSEGYIIVRGLLSKTGSYGRETLTIGARQFEDV